MPDFLSQLINCIKSSSTPVSARTFSLDAYFTMPDKTRGKLSVS